MFAFVRSAAEPSHLYSIDGQARIERPGALAPPGCFSNPRTPAARGGPPRLESVAGQAIPRCGGSPHDGPRRRGGVREWGTSAQWRRAAAAPPGEIGQRLRRPRCAIRAARPNRESDACFRRSTDRGEVRLRKSHRDIGAHVPTETSSLSASVRAHTRQRRHKNEGEGARGRCGGRCAARAYRPRSSARTRARSWCVRRTTASAPGSR